MPHRTNTTLVFCCCLVVGMGPLFVPLLGGRSNVCTARLYFCEGVTVRARAQKIRVLPWCGSSRELESNVPPPKCIGICAER